MCGGFKGCVIVWSFISRLCNVQGQRMAVLLSVGIQCSLHCHETACFFLPCAVFLTSFCSGIIIYSNFVLCVACRNILSYTAEEDSNANKWVALPHFLFLSFNQPGNWQEHPSRHHDWYSHSLSLLRHDQCGILCRAVKGWAPFIRSNGIGENNCFSCVDFIPCHELLLLQCVLVLVATVIWVTVIIALMTFID